MTPPVKPCAICGTVFSKKPSESKFCWQNTRKYCSRDCSNAGKRGQKLSAEHVEKLRASATGRRHTPATRLNMSGENAHRWGGGKPKCVDCATRVSNPAAKRCFACSRKRMVGSAAGNWQGGITLINAKARNSNELTEWRKAVFLRDDFTCQCCGERGGRIQADHIKPFSLFPALRIDLENGRTLCKACHHKHGARVWGGRLYKGATALKLKTGQAA